ncbi:hypothetical protein [Streptomyces sp. NPDC086010]|uniref:hypothetical protein n=1 Tax=Streptomyces sp. NPDC086010 TaxID=3365745 RepID=UPI0037D4D5AD
MASLIGLLEVREREAVQRVEVLRAEAERVLAELRDAELDRERFAVAWEAVVEVLAGPCGAESVDAPSSEDPESPPLPSPSSVGSVVPPWWEGLEVSALSLEYQRVVSVLAAAGTSLACKGLASRL